MKETQTWHRFMWHRFLPGSGDDREHSQAPGEEQYGLRGKNEAVAGFEYIEELFGTERYGLIHRRRNCKARLSLSRAGGLVAVDHPLFYRSTEDLPK